MLVNFLYFISILFQDLKLQLFLGKLAASPMFFTVFFILIIYRKNIKIENITKVFFIYFLISLSISLSVLFFYTITDGSENLLVKTFKSSMYNFINMLVVLVTYNMLIRLGLIKFLKIFMYMYILLIIWLIIESIDKSIFSIFHAHEYLNLNIRHRLSTQEVSQAFPFFILVSMFSYIYLISVNTNLSKKLLFVLCSLVASFFILSKGGFIIFVISVFLTYVIIFGIKKVLKFLPLLIIFLFFEIWFLITTIIPMINADIELYTSFATRGVSLLSIPISLYYFPFGIGYGTYTIYLPEVFMISMDIFNSLLGINLNYNELNQIIESGDNLAIKSGLGFQIVQTGIIGLFFYIYIYAYTFKIIHALKNIELKFILMMITIFSLLEILLVVNFEVFYIYLIIFSFVSYIKYLKKKEANHENIIY